MDKIAYMAYKNKLLVVQTVQQKRTKSLAKMFIKRICEYRDFDENKTKYYMNDEKTIQEIERSITLGFMEYKTTETNYHYMHIESNSHNEIMNYPMKDFYNDVVVLGNI